MVPYNTIYTIDTICTKNKNVSKQIYIQNLLYYIAYWIWFFVSPEKSTIYNLETIFCLQFLSYRTDFGVKMTGISSSRPVRSPFFDFWNSKIFLGQEIRNFLKKFDFFGFSQKFHELFWNSKKGDRTGLDTKNPNNLAPKKIF